MNSFLFFSSQTFFCLRRSGFVIGARENGVGARPNFLYAGKTLLMVLLMVLIMVLLMVLIMVLLMVLS